MTDMEKVISALECISNGAKQPCRDCEYSKREEWCIAECAKDALALLKAQEQRRRLEVHNIGNVDIPEGVSWEQFQAVMTGVVAALEHTEKGESWPYDKGEGRSNDA